LVAIIVGVGVAVVMIIGIIAAIAIPNLLNAIHRGRQKRTVADMRTIGTAVEAYAVDNYRYPYAGSIAELAAELEPKYVRNLPRTDGWGGSFEYACWQVDPDSTGCDRYVLASPGKDFILEVQDLGEYAAEQTRTRIFDCDIVYSNGSFVQFPEGL
jgi:type II secretory pathway pseudopilin PulG